MFSYRITKYNPKFRDEYGIYLNDDWTDISDIGNMHEGKVVTTEDYLKAEDGYVLAVELVMDFLKLSEIAVTFYQKVTYTSPVKLTPSMKRVYKKIHLGMIATRAEVPDIIRLNLRNQLGCRLESEDMFVHFGWDYYMFVGSKHKLPASLINKIQKMGIFVEEFESPYHPEPEDIN